MAKSKPKKQKSYRLEASYNRMDDKTLFILWDGMTIVNSKNIDGDYINFTNKEFDKIKEELINEK